MSRKLVLNTLSYVQLAHSMVRPGLIDPLRNQAHLSVFLRVPAPGARRSTRSSTELCRQAPFPAAPVVGGSVVGVALARSRCDVSSARISSSPFRERLAS